ncbi:putative LysR family regulatory protein [Talaromyces proteolyticus]|uniref:LysR family regulatory protein n=1 Tax=Talaromyces proteolyticus TaxID=1131652 RepID=A0AAD4KEG9_9EURO|nr:putative LysR family regulatory protein [Talaromyces proteolyticus]KAH8690015.1 putative LysR family regulatory protein [Talaromyces proteolyticus]
MGVFFSKQPPPTVSTDQVIPFRFADDFPYTRGLCLDIHFRFDDVLDPEKLRDALERLLQKDGWRKLGARLRRTKDDKLEYHVPAEFSEKRPAVLYSTDKHNASISDHPVLSQLPRGSGERPALFESPIKFRPYMRAANGPEHINDWLYADIPQLVVHVIGFNDATIITVTFMHTLTDAMGIVALLRAWTAVLRGEDEKVPPFVGFDKTDDPIETLHKEIPASKFVLANRVVKGLEFFKFVVRMIFELVWWPTDEGGTVFVPGEYIKTLRESAIAELSKTQTSSDKDSDMAKPFLSESDVLVAWWMRVLARTINPPPHRTITLMNVFDIRGVLAELGRVSSPNIALFANATYASTSLIPAGDFISPDVPLSSLASRIRNAIDTQRTPEQLQAQAALLRESVEKTGHAPLMGDSGMLLTAVSNWHRGKLFQVDFSAAVVAQKAVSRANRPKESQTGKPSFITTSATYSGFSIRYSQAVIGKDLAGNWWLTSCLRAGMWKKVAEQIQIL